MKGLRIGKDPLRIRRMFSGIAGTYDLLNHILSLNADRSWRRRAARLLDPQPGERILDACTGTADLALELALRAGDPRGTGGAVVVGADFCPEMVRLAGKKVLARNGSRPRAASVVLTVADALRLPFPGSSFDAAAVAFGIRNLQELSGGLREMLRVLRPGGRAAILEFTRPPRAWYRALFGIYFQRVLPWIGRRIVRSRDPEALGAYAYLPASVSDFPDADRFARSLEEAGFENVRFRRLGLGIACVHLGEKTRAAPSGREGS